MQETFDSKSKSVGGLLGLDERAQIFVPEFQRGYSWEKKHVDAFWRDVSSFHRERKKAGGPTKYFLGPIVTLAKSEERTEVLDGQQRLATATILLCVIRDVMRSLDTLDSNNRARDLHTQLIVKDQDNKYSLVLGDLDRQYLIDTIQSDPPKPSKHKTKSHRNIATAREFLNSAVRVEVSSLGKVDAIAHLRSLQQAIRTDLVMACIPVASERDAFLIFESLNDRGLRLSVPDLLLNYLMRTAEPEERSQIRSYWTQMLSVSAKRDVGAFLRHMWVSRYGDVKKDLFSALKAHIEEQKISSIEFTRECTSDLESYIALADASEELGKAAHPVRSLVQQLGCRSALPLLLSAWTKHPHSIDEIARLALVFFVRHSVACRLDSGELESVMFGLTTPVRESASADAAVAVVRDTLSKQAPTDDRFGSGLQEATLDADEARYVVRKIAEYAQSGSKAVALNESNIEHVFPQSANVKDWPNADELEPLTWNIGNLTAFPSRMNKGLGNKAFAEKRLRYQDCELVMAKEVAKHTTWNPKAIGIRAETMAKRAKEIWKWDRLSYV